MTGNIKLTAKIMAKSSFKWIFIFGLGIVTTTITLCLALFIAFNSFDNGSMPHSGGGAGGIIILFSLLTQLFFNNFFAFILIIGSPIFIGLYVILAQKISMQHALYLLWQDRLGDYILGKAQAVIARIVEKEGWRQNISDKVMLKARLLQVASEEEYNSKLQRKIISYCFETISLDDIDFSKEDLKLSDVITIKLQNFIEEMAEPSMLIVWLLIAVQFACLILAFFI